MLTKDILECLEQKRILMEQILNITKQMEVQAMEESINLGDLLDQRGLLMQRVDKCNLLIQSRLEEQSPQDQERVRAVLAQQIPEENCTSDERHAMLLSSEITRLFDQAAALNRSALDLLHVQYEDVKKNLADSKEPGNQNNMFSFR